METLEDLGLTKYEAQVYLALLSSGLDTARNLSSKSQVPTGRIYDVLRSLVNKRLVIKQDSRPLKYMPVQPRNAVKTLLQRKTEELQTLKEKAILIEEQLNVFSKTTPDESLFWSVSIGEDLNCNGHRIAEAEKELLCCIELDSKRCDECIPDMLHFLEIKSELAEKGVDMKILVGARDEKIIRNDVLPHALPYLERLKHVPIRVTEAVTTSFDIIDKEKVILWVRNPTNPDRYLAAIYIWQKKLADELRNRFNEVWETARVFHIEK